MTKIDGFDLVGKFGKDEQIKKALGEKFKNVDVDDVRIAELLISGDGVVGYNVLFNDDGSVKDFGDDTGREAADIINAINNKTQKPTGFKNGRELFNLAAKKEPADPSKYIEPQVYDKLSVEDKEKLKDPKLLLAMLDKEGNITKSAVKNGIRGINREFSFLDNRDKGILDKYLTICAELETEDSNNLRTKITPPKIITPPISEIKEVEESPIKPAIKNINNNENAAAKILNNKANYLKQAGSPDKMAADDKLMFEKAQDIVKNDPRLSKLSGYDLTAFLDLKKDDDFNNKCKITAFLKFCDYLPNDGLVTPEEAQKGIKEIIKYEK